MLTAINNISFKPQYRINNSNNNRTFNKTPKIQQLTCDTLSFTGKLSLPSLYSSTFEYIAATILRRSKDYSVDSRTLSHEKISDAVQKLFDENQIFKPFKEVTVDKIKWRDYVPEDVREGSIIKINEARKDRFFHWQRFLENPEGRKINSTEGYDEKLVGKVKNNNPLKLVIWEAIKSEIKDNNRHIPVPFNEKALLETIEEIELIQPKSRAVRCAKPSFIDLYTHRLRDNLLMDLGLSDNQSVWVRIPSIKHDPKHKDYNVSMLEILSSKNWCTRSSVDKAEDALTEGDFHILLERDNLNMWQTRLGLSLSRGKVDQIQGPENNNILPLTYLDDLKAYIAETNLPLRSGANNEGPKAYQAILIGDKLKETNSTIKKNLAKAIKDNDSFGMFKCLGIKVEKDENELLTIETYRPVYSLKPQNGISVPYSMFGINENILLKNVKVINGNLILFNKNDLFNSLITQFPPNLEKVTGKIECTAEQFEKFGQDLMRVVDFDQSRIRIH